MRLLVICSVAVLLAEVRVAAQTGDNVAVIVNDASPASRRIADHYIQKRAVPDANVIHINTAASDEIDRATFVAAIEQPIAAAIAKRNLQDRILYIVLTKGVPLRIAGTTGLQGTVASVDSELTLLYRKLAGTPAPVRGRIDNPYFWRLREIAEAKPFSHADQDIFLVTRLDAFTVGEAMALIDRAAAPSNEGMIVLDDRTAGYRASQDGLDQASNRLAAAGFKDRVLLDKSERPVRNVSPVIGYYSWGSNDPANRTRKVGIGFAPGAIAGSYVSADGRTFEEPPASWSPSNDANDRASWFAGSPQSLVGDIIREGATGAAAQVAEPFADAAVRPQVLFPAYVAGFNLAESFYLAMPYLSWQTIVIGDPLCRPFAGKTLTAAQIGGAIDPATELPNHFSRRRLEAAPAAFGSGNRALIPLAVRADARIARGDMAGARKDLEQAIAVDPQFTWAQFQLALFDDAAGAYDSAIERYRRVIELQPRHAAALNNLAYNLAVHKGRPADAKPLAQRALTLTPHEPVLLDTYGWILHLLGDDAEASRVLRTAESAAPGNAEIHMHAAFAYAGSGAKAAAVFALNTAVKLDPLLAARTDVRHLREQLEKR